MAVLKELLQTADWKAEKHVPVIDVPAAVKKAESISVSITVGKEIPHPNTTEHHISWIEVYFLGEGEKFPYQLARFEFSAHGASTKGPNTSTVYSEPKAAVAFKTEKAGTLLASSYCNIHGLWESTKQIEVS